MNLEAVTSLFAHFPTDWIIIVVLSIFIAFDALRSGLGRVTALALSLPATLFLAGSLSQARILSGVAGQFSTPLLKAVLFGIVFAAAYLLVRRMAPSYATGSGEVIQALLAGVAGTITLVIVWLQVPELQAVWHFGSQVQAVFGEAYRFWWIALSYLVLAFVRS